MPLFRGINLLAIALCFVVVVFGAYVRLSDAGLGCPDWPGCYGQLTVPAEHHELAAAEQAYPQRPVEAPKAWKEMIHRYLVGFLSTALLALVALAAFDRGHRTPLRTVLAIVGVVLVQIVFGMLTVTLKVNPLIVTTHLLLGLTTLSLLWWMWLGGRAAVTSAASAGLRGFALFALLLLVAQIFLGGWTSTNYAALACPDFPTCHGSFWPQGADFHSGFTLWHGSDVNYEFGILDNSGRMAIHLTHRYGAAVIGGVLGALGFFLLLGGHALLWRRLGLALLAALSLQITIGISIVKLQLPLLLADMHCAGAAVLLLTMVTINHFAWNSRTKP